MPTEQETFNLSLPCRHLRSKEMYYESTGQEDNPFSNAIYWCTQTQENFGPDGLPCGKTECCAGRVCHLP